MVEPKTTLPVAVSVPAVVLPVLKPAARVPVLRRVAPLTVPMPESLPLTAATLVLLRRPSTSRLAPLLTVTEIVPVTEPLTRSLPPVPVE